MENVHFQKQLDTIEEPHNKHTIEDQGCSWGTPLKNCVSAVFLLGVIKASLKCFLFVQKHVASIHGKNKSEKHMLNKKKLASQKT